MKILTNKEIKQLIFRVSYISMKLRQYIENDPDNYYLIQWDYHQRELEDLLTNIFNKKRKNK